MASPDLSIRVNRKRLPARKRAYFQLLTYCRSIGFEKKSDARTFWVARFRTKSQGYKQIRLGKTDTIRRADGMEVLSFEQAIDKAILWFDSPENKKIAALAYPLGPATRLSYSPIGDTYTVGCALIEYFEWKQLISTPATFHTLLTTANLHIIPRLASLPAESINGEIIRRFIREVLEKPPKRGRQAQKPKTSIDSLDDESLRKRKKTVNKLMSILRKALEMAWENGKIDNERAWRCCKHIRTVDRPRVLHLSREECRLLLAACEPDLRRLVLGALYTGCRFTELVRMRVSHVGKDGYGVYVTPVKSYKPRFVFLPDEGMTFFFDLIKGKSQGEAVFVRDNGTKWKYNLRHVFKAAIRKARLPDEFTFHGLRHTYASQLIQAGTPMIVVADQLGHANTNTVSQTYGHLSPQIREAEVRQRFTEVDVTTARKSKRNRKKLKEWRESLYGGNWRTYATIHDLVAVGHTE